MKINCNIIRDLLPSYIDHICSEETRNLVEEHIKTCEGCRMILEGMEDTQVNMAGNEALQIDHMKKIRNRYNTVSLGSYLLLFLMMASVIYFTCQNAPFFHFTYWNMSVFPDALFRILLPIMVLASFLTAGNERTFTKKKTCMCGISILFFLLQIGLMNWAAHICSGFNNGVDRFPFGMEIVNFGPFIKNCLLVFMAGELILQIYSIINGRLKNIDNSYCAAISTAGVFLALYYINMLRMLENLDRFMYLSNKTAAVLTAELIVLLIGYNVALRLKQSSC